ncbi:hypothetical protein F5B18DRAFT_5880 [Nemania serpens]|nr:hypothetical protein F5B18DRAFT_5880 [Nemania serpens]
MPVVPGSYWDLLRRNTPPVKRRATHAKARTGCLTCKKRRVKCDEARPHCARCIKSGHKCTGYQDRADLQPQQSRRADSSSDGRPRHRDRPAAAQLPLRPRPSVAVPGGRRVGGDCGVVDLARASLTPAYLDVQDALYFDRFRCQMLEDLGVWCGAEYWRHTILREIMVDKMVQHAALGAAAMLMDIEQQQCERAQSQQVSDERYASPSQTAAEETTAGATTADEEERTETTPAAGDEREDTPPAALVSVSGKSAHGKAALRHYTTAISLCRRSLAAEGVTSSTARSSLTATFFFAVFELVQGNVGEADRILANGVSLLDDALSQTNPDGGPKLIPDDELREIQLAFDRMCVTWGLCPYFGGGSDIYTRTTTTPRTAGVRHFELPSLDAPMRTKQVFWNAFSSDFGQFMLRVQEDCSGMAMAQGNGLGLGLPAILAQRTNYLVQLCNWLPILEDLCVQHPGSAVLCTTKVYAQTAIIFLNCFLDASDLAYDAYLPMFKDIVAAYRRLMPSRLPQQQGYLRFTLDVDLFHIITFTVSKCRDRETRARALRVFGEMTRRQALWTNSGMLAALRALADLEDEGRGPDGFVPASARYRYVSSEWDFDRRRMMAVFVPVVSAATQTGDVSAVRIPVRF